MDSAFGEAQIQNPDQNWQNHSLQNRNLYLTEAGIHYNMEHRVCSWFFLFAHLGPNSLKDSHDFVKKWGKKDHGFWVCNELGWTRDDWWILPLLQNETPGNNNLTGPLQSLPLQNWNPATTKSKSQKIIDFEEKKFIKKCVCTSFTGVLML